MIPRIRISRKLGNPRLKQITFHTLRHWKVTLEYHKTKDILRVMKILGHRNIKNTLIYTELVTFEDEDYICKAAANIKEATELIEAGYEYVSTLKASDCSENASEHRLSPDLGFAQRP